MRVKNLIYFISISILLSGCSQIFVDKKKLEAVDARLANIEQNMPKKLTDNISQKLDEGFYIHDQNMNKALKLCLERQRENFDYLKNELTALIKPEIILISKERVKKPPIVVKKQVTSLNEKMIVGSVEKVHIYPSDFIMNARIDTGADTSSIDARDIVEFERDGKKWVRFKLVDEKSKKEHLIERRVSRVVKILQSSQESGYDKRVVVKLRLTIGDKTELSEFSLTNREHMQYPILIGRNALKDIIVVDVSSKYLAPLVVKKDLGFKK